MSSIDRALAKCDEVLRLCKEIEDEINRMPTVPDTFTILGVVMGTGAFIVIGVVAACGYWAWLS